MRVRLCKPQANLIRCGLATHGRSAPGRSCAPNPIGHGLSLSKSSIVRGSPDPAPVTDRRSPASGDLQSAWRPGREAAPDQKSMFSYELRCSNCGWQTVSGIEDAVTRLRIIGQLRRDKEPDEALVAELLVDSAPRMTCPLCKEKRLSARPTADDDVEEWQAAILCEVCRQPIDAERLEAIPSTKRCAACQGKAEAGKLVDEPDYCPHCGALVEVRISRGSGVTRYKRFCTGEPPCRL